MKEIKDYKYHSLNGNNILKIKFKIKNLMI